MRFKNLAVAFIVLVMLMASGVLALPAPCAVVYASESDAAESDKHVFNPELIITDPGEDGGINGRLSSLCSEINGKLHDAGLFVKRGFGDSVTYNDFLSYSESPLSEDSLYGVMQSNITINMSDYKKLNMESKKKVFKITLDSIINSQLKNQSNRTKLYNFVSVQDSTVSSLVRQLSDDIQADFYGAYNLVFRPFSGLIGMLLGCATLAIVVSLSLTIVIDLAYLVIPACNISLSKFCEVNFFKMGFQFKIVSIEAIKAYEQSCAASGISYISPVVAYFKMKSKQLAALCICLVYLLSGHIYTLIASFMDLFLGFLPR